MAPIARKPVSKKKKCSAASRRLRAGRTKAIRVRAAKVLGGYCRKRRVVKRAVVKRAVVKRKVVRKAKLNWWAAYLKKHGATFRKYLAEYKKKYDHPTAFGKTAARMRKECKHK